MNESLESALLVTEVQRDRVSLFDGEREHPARLLPALQQALQMEDDAVAVGDRVHAQRNALGEWWVGERLARRNVIARRDTYGHRQVLVSNVDTVLLVMGLDHDFNLRRLERYLALVRLAQVQPVLVLTKADASDADAVAARTAQAHAALPPAVAVFALDGRDPATAATLAPWLAPGHTLVVLGSSGAGKSTLTNTLAGTRERTGAARADDSRGRHTTTWRSLHRCPGGACIVDTPGLRTLRLDADEAGLEQVFDDIARWSTQCRFRDCRHDGEPGCAVREAVPAERVRNFHKLQREARRDTLSALERHHQVRQWKARGREARVNQRMKRGEG
jgi:ribosome biogenesis GTPase